MKPGLHIRKKIHPLLPIGTLMKHHSKSQTFRIIPPAVTYQLRQLSPEDYDDRFFFDTPLEDAQIRPSILHMIQAPLTLGRFSTEIRL